MPILRISFSALSSILLFTTLRDLSFWIHQIFTRVIKSQPNIDLKSDYDVYPYYHNVYFLYQVVCDLSLILGVISFYPTVF